VPLMLLVDECTASTTTLFVTHWGSTTVDWAAICSWSDLQCGACPHSSLLLPAKPLCQCAPRCWL